jgi:hypothetical protein
VCSKSIPFTCRCFLLCKTIEGTPTSARGCAIEPNLESELKSTVEDSEDWRVQRLVVVVATVWLSPDKVEKDKPIGDLLRSLLSVITSSAWPY